MSYRVCFNHGKAWYTRSTSEYLEKKGEGKICQCDKYRYSSHKKYKIPEEIEIEREKGESW